MDLISRQDVIDLIMETDPFWAEGTTRAIFEGVKKIRAASCVEPIVRCKDCKYYWKNGKHKSNLEFMEDVLMCLASPSDDAFCSEGERKDDE